MHFTVFGEVVVSSATPKGVSAGGSRAGAAKSLMRGGDVNIRGGAREQVRKLNDVPMLISERACKRMIGHNELRTSNWQRYTGTLAYKQ